MTIPKLANASQLVEERTLSASDIERLRQLLEEN